MKRQGHRGTNPEQGGGLVPFITSAAYASTHSLTYALAYPIIVPAVAFLSALFIMPQTHKRTMGAAAPAPAMGGDR